MKTTLVLFLAMSAAHAAALTPAEQKIQWARQAIEQHSDSHQDYNDLAMALARRARETADPRYYEQAEGALRKSFELAPDNFEGLKTRAWILLGKHEFAKALQIAAALNRRVPDDIQVYGLLTDAHAELGNYKEAEEACQKMLDLRPGNVAALTRAAYLRELFGNLPGALELMNAAFQRTPPSEVEDRAWILTQIGHLELLGGNPAAAERLLGQALTLFPGYHYALGKLAEVRTAQKHYAEAADLQKRRYEAAPHPENLYGLAEALQRAGHRTEARAAFTEFERVARGEMNGADNANRELVFYYADHARRPAEALRIAREELKRRSDVHTLDALAWALHKSGLHAEARRQIEAVLAVGVRDPRVLAHGEAIGNRMQLTKR